MAKNDPDYDTRTNVRKTDIENNCNFENDVNGRLKAILRQKNEKVHGETIGTLNNDFERLNEDIRIINRHLYEIYVHKKENRYNKQAGGNETFHKNKEKEIIEDLFRKDAVVEQPLLKFLRNSESMIKNVTWIYDHLHNEWSEYLCNDSGNGNGNGSDPPPEPPTDPPPGGDD